MFERCQGVEVSKKGRDQGRRGEGGSIIGSKADRVSERRGMERRFEGVKLVSWAEQFG